MELPVAPTAFAGALKPLAITRMSGPMTAIGFGKGLKSVAGTAMGIDVRGKGKAEGASRGAPPPKGQLTSVFSGGAGGAGGAGGSAFARRPRNGARLNSASFSLSFP